MLSSPLDSGGIGAYKSVQPGACAAMHLACIVSRGLGAVIFISVLTFGCGHWLELIPLHPSLQVYGDSLPERVDETLPAPAIILTILIHVPLVPRLPNFMFVAWVSCERQGTLSPEGHGKRYECYLKAKVIFEEHVFPPWTLLRGHVDYDLGEVQRCGTVTDSVTGQGAGEQSPPFGDLLATCEDWPWGRVPHGDIFSEEAIGTRACRCLRGEKWDKGRARNLLCLVYHDAWDNLTSKITRL